mmetsp:Transcript_7406/g.7494  ORF Transcript_7406/g.7494 Transcript_7406/m.7494 type:complete len:168 (+) Transcript_7406:241-744(+)
MSSCSRWNLFYLLFFLTSKSVNCFVLPYSPSKSSFRSMLRMESNPVGTVVAYSRCNPSNSSEISLLLGVINELGHLNNLEQRSGEGNNSLSFHENEHEESIDVFFVVHVFDDNDIYLTQRIVEDRISNPHGEHAEDVWIINLRDLMINKTSDFREYKLDYLTDVGFN